MANQRISGTCYITVDGEELNLSGSLQIPVNKYTRQAVTASGRVIGYSETPVVPSISGNFYVDSDFPLEKLRTATDMTIVAELANGMRYTLSDAFLAVDNANFAPEDGTVQLVFNGVRGDWS